MAGSKWSVGMTTRRLLRAWIGRPWTMASSISNLRRRRPISAVRSCSSNRWVDCRGPDASRVARSACLRLDLGPGVLEGQRAVEHQMTIGRVGVDAEVAQALELECRARRFCGQ